MRLISTSELPPDRLEVLFFAAVERFDHIGKKFTSYAAKRRFGSLEWVIDHRYSEFSSFHDKLKSDFPSIPLPKFPAKHALEKQTPDFIKNRSDKLCEYLKILLLLPDELVQSSQVLSFIGMLSTVRNDVAEKGKSWKVLHITKLKEVCGIGDVILFKSRNTASTLQRRVTGSEWDHVAIIVGGGTSLLVYTFIILSFLSEFAIIVNLFFNFF